MKIDIRYIVRDHMRTLRNAQTNKVSVSDIVLFYAVPAALAGAAFWLKFEFKKADVFNVSVTFFGIFIALLLNIQVAIFAVFQRKWGSPIDDRMKDYQDKKFKDRQKLLSEMNANLSYLVLVSCLALFVLFVFYVQECLQGIGPAITVFIYTHFFLTLIMIVKRAHALFQSEYDHRSDG